MHTSRLLRLLMNADHGPVHLVYRAMIGMLRKVCQFGRCSPSAFDAVEGSTSPAKNKAACAWDLLMSKSVTVGAQTI